jgi:geranylgeranyl diphosphate synthase, type I
MIDKLIEKLSYKINLALKKFLYQTYKLPVDYPEVESFYEETLQYVLRKGKRIRPIFFVIGSYLYNDNISIDNDTNIQNSICLELLQSFFLCHDDIIDNSDLRRGEDSLHVVLNKIIQKQNTTSTQQNYSQPVEPGKLFAIISGDIHYTLTSMALNKIKFETALLKEQFIDIFYKYVMDTTIGQVIDMSTSYKSIDDVTKDIIYNTYELKTAKYSVECPLVLGAIYSKANEDELNKLKEYAINLGVAFQLQDDLIGLFGTVEELGKPITSDILEEKKTLLILDTVENLNDRDKDKFKKLFYKRPLTKTNFDEIKKLVIKSGAFEKSVNQIEKLLQKTYSISDELIITSEKRDTLKMISEKLLSKYKTLDNI